MKKNAFIKYIGGIALVLMLLILTGCSTDDNAAPEATQASATETEIAAAEQTEGAASEETADAAAGTDLVIPLAGITTDASFYAATVDGVDLEVIAVQAPAFNTCQICYGSGRAYYVQDGNELVCQNCMNRFSMSDVEVVSGGCNPWPIFDQDKTVDETNITIPYTFLKQSVALFENWKSIQY